MTQTYKVQVSMNQAHIVESGFVWKQGDFGFNIEIEVLDFDTTGATPQIIFRKSNGAVEATTITRDGNKFTYAIRGTELDTPGPCVCDLKLKDSTTKRVSTASFKYFVIPDTMDGLNQQASSYSDTIAQIVEGFDDDIAALNSDVTELQSTLRYDSDQFVAESEIAGQTYKNYTAAYAAEESYGQRILISNGVASITATGRDSAYMRTNQFSVDGNTLIQVNIGTAKFGEQYGFICVDANNNVLLDRLNAKYPTMMAKTPANTTEVWVTSYAGRGSVTIYEPEAESESEMSKVASGLEVFGTWEYLNNQTYETGYVWVEEYGKVASETNANYRRISAAVNPGDYLQIKVRTTTNPDFVIILFADSQGNVIKSVNQKVSATAVNAYKEIVPDGATQVYINGLGGVEYIKVLKTIPLPKNWNYSFLDIASEALLPNCRYTAKSQDVYLTASYANVDAATNKVTIITSGVNNYRHAEYVVEAGKIYMAYFRANDTANGMPMIFTDSNGTVLQCYRIFEQVTKNWFLKAPEGATRLYLTTYASGIYLYEITGARLFDVSRALVINGGDRPSFTYCYTHTNQGVVTVTLPTHDLNIYSGGGDDGSNTTQYRIIPSQGERTFNVANSRCLIWNFNTNTIEVVDANKIPNNSVTLFSHTYGYAQCGIWKPFYDEQFGEGLRDLEYYVGQQWEYDKDYLQTKLAEIRPKKIATGITGDTFIFCSDSHYKAYNNNGDAARLIGNVCKSTGINKVIHGGDLIYAYTETEAEMDREAWFHVEIYKRWVKPWARLYNIIGNHDVHASSAPGGTYFTWDDTETYNALFTDQEDYIIQNSSDMEGMYYYFDNEKHKIRYICMNSNQEDKTAQVSFVSSALQSAPVDYLFVFSAHIPFIQEHSSDYYKNADLYEVMKPYASRTIGCFCGHSHKDFLKVEDGMVHMCIKADARLDRASGAARTTDAGVFDVVCIDRENSRVDLIRVGEGDNRAFTYGTNPAIIDQGDGQEGFPTN